MQMQQLDLVVRGGRLALPWGVVEGDLGVHKGRIVAIGRVDEDSAATLDARGLHVLPGLIDTQVHFREPGAEHKEDLATGGDAAVLGGVTTVFEMPNTRPATTTAALLADKLARAQGRMRCDHAFFIGATAENAHELGSLEHLPGCAGVKIFMGSSTGSLLVEDDVTLQRVLRSGRRRVAVHAEDEPRLRQRKELALAGEPWTHPVWRDVEAATLATARLLGAARETGRPVHVLHVTTADGAGHAGRAPRHRNGRGHAAASDVRRARLLPGARDASADEPARSWSRASRGSLACRRQRPRRRAGFRSCPAYRGRKDLPAYPQSPSGMTGVQTMLPVMLDHVAGGRLTLERLVDLASAGPARIYGIAAKGRLALGYDADLALVDLGARRTVQPAWLASRAGWSPFEGRQLTGWPVATLVRGRLVARDGTLLGNPEGAPVRFIDTLVPHPAVGCISPAST